MSDALMWSELIHVPQTDMNWATTTREPNSDLDRSAFLNLLITQLRHQDPLNPMEDRDFIAQMAQFSTLEQMMNLNNTFERTQAFGMIGKIIDAEFFNPVSEEWVEIEGRFVTGVRRQGDTVFLTVLGEDGRPIDVPFDSVREVSEDFFVTQQLYDIFSTVQGQRATDLIGRYTQAIAISVGENGENASFIEGRVDSVKLAGSQAVLVVGNREIFMHEVFSVADRMQLIGSPYFTNGGPGGTVTGVDIGDNRAYLVFSNGNRVRVNRINHATEALAFVNQHINSPSEAVEGYVRSVTINGGIPFLNVYRYAPPFDRGERIGQVDFLNYLANRAEGTNSSSPSGSGTLNTQTHATNAQLAGSRNFTNSGAEVRRVEQQGDRVYVVFDDANSTRVHTMHINAIVQANAYVNSNSPINFNGVSGYARFVHIASQNAGTPMLIVYDWPTGGREVGRVNFVNYLASLPSDDTGNGDAT